MSDHASRPQLETLAPVSTGELMYAEDLTAGTSIELGYWDVGLEDILAFARQWDPLPIHIDVAAAEAGPHGGIIASGLHTMAIMQRLNVTGFLSRVAIIAGRSSNEMRFPAPVRPGSRLHGRQTVDSVTLRESGRAVVATTATMVDQTGTMVLSLSGDMVVAQRSAQSPAGGAE